MPNYASFSAPQMVEAFDNAFAQPDKGLWYPQVAKLAPDTSEETLRVTAGGQTLGLRKHPAGRQPDAQNKITYVADITKDSYSDFFDVPVLSLNANPESWLNQASEMGSAARWDVQRLIIDHLNASRNCLDSATQYGARVFGNAPSQTNALTSSQVSSLNIGTPSLPTVPEMVTALTDVFGYMKLYKGDAGRTIGQPMRDFVVVANTQAIGGAIEAALTKETLASGETNTLAASIKNGTITARSIIEPDLSTSNAFWVFCATPGFKPFTVGLSEIRDTSVSDPASEFARLNNAVRFQVSVDFAVCNTHFYTTTRCVLS